VILYEDECSLSNTATLSYSWNIIGKQPKIKQKQNKRERQTLFGCVEPATGIVIAKRTDKGNARTFKSFLIKAIKKYQGKKVIMILDNVRYHHAKMLKPFLEKNKDRIELFFLPPYSPDLNPMERIWWYMRKNITHNRFVNTLKERIAWFWQLFSHFNIENEICKKLCNLCVNK
jgi:putative transposase